MGDQDIGSPGRPVSSGLQVAGEPGHCCARTRPPWWPSRGTPLVVALSPGHSDISRFRPWSPIGTGNHFDRAEKIPKVAQTTGTFDVITVAHVLKENVLGK